jgi:hypothetical protein
MTADLHHRCSQLLERSHSSLSTLFLGETQERIEDNNGQDRDRLRVVTEENRNRGSDQKDHHHGRGQLLPQKPPGAFSLAFF